MKIALTTACWMLSICAMAQKHINVLSFNLRLDVASDSANNWQYRKDLVASQILFHEADIIGVQEALPNQMQDLRDRLPNYASHGVGREDGANKGEFSAIFYNNVRFKKLDGSTFWLSTTPTVAGSKGWDAQITRIVSWVKLKDATTNKILYAFNTHFDHIGQEARRQSAHMLLKAVDSIAGKYPAIVTGDFNSKPSQEPIKIIVDKTNPFHLVDAKSKSLSPHYGPSGSFTAFQQQEIDDEPIDYIFIKGNWKVLQHANLSQTWKGRFSSDHFPIFARLIVQ